MSATLLPALVRLVLGPLAATERLVFASRKCGANARCTRAQALLRPLHGYVRVV